MINFLTNMAIVVLMSSIVIITVLVTRKLFSNWLNLSIMSILWIIVLARLIIPITVDSPITLNNLFGNENTTNNAIQPSEFTNIDNYETNGMEYSYYNADALETYNNYDTQYEYNTSTNTNNTAVTNSRPANTITIMDTIKSIFGSNKFWAVLAIIWMFGAWIVFLINAFAIYDFNKKVNSCIEVNNRATRRSLTMGKTILNIRRPVKVYECKFIDTPVTCGLFSNKYFYQKTLQLLLTIINYI